MSRALDPPPCAPLQHINGATGTNCPTLDVLESQIASAASRAASPASTSTSAANTNSTNNRGKKTKIENGRSRLTKAARVRLCATVNCPLEFCFGSAAFSPPLPFDFGVAIQRWHWFRFFFFFQERAPPHPVSPPATALLLQMPSAAIFLANLQHRQNSLLYSAHV